MDNTHLRRQTALRDDIYHNCIAILTHNRDLVYHLRAIIYALQDGLDPDIALDTVTKADYHIIAGKDQ